MNVLCASGSGYISVSAKRLGEESLAWTSVQKYLCPGFPYGRNLNFFLLIFFIKVSVKKGTTDKCTD